MAFITRVWQVDTIAYGASVSSDIKTPPAERQGKYLLRTLESLRIDHQRFLSAGGDLMDAKDYNNVIGEHFVSIPLENVQYNTIALCNSLKYIHVHIGVHSWSAPFPWNL